MDAAEEQVRARAARRGGDALGHGLCERGEQEVDQLRLQIGVAADRWAGMADVHDAARRRDDAHRPVAARVPRHQHLRVGDAEDRVVDRGRRDDVRAVHRTGHLRARAGEVGDHLVAAYDQRDPDLERVGRDAVVLDEHRRLVAPVGELGDLGPQAPLRMADQRLGARTNGVDPVAVDQREQPPLADVQRSDHGVEVAPGRPRRAVVREDHPPELLVVAARLDQLHRWQPQALLVDVGRVGGEAAGRLAADLGQVADRAGERRAARRRRTPASSACARGCGSCPGRGRCGRRRRRGRRSPRRAPRASSGRCA